VDPTAVDQVLWNLLTNAVKYGGGGPRIDLTLETVDGWVSVAVHDRGPGIPEAEIEQVFQPYVRSDAQASAVGGLGLGLSVCRTLMESQGGEMFALPRAGGGMTFGFRLRALIDEPLEACAKPGDLTPAASSS
jgi:signal transduction histidine kinase